MRERVMVNAHTNYPSYKDAIPALTGFLTWLGVVWVRDNNEASPLTASGFKVQVVIRPGTDASITRQVNTAIANGAARIECVNEPKPTDIATVKTQNALIVKTVANRVPVVSSALALPNASSAPALGIQPGAQYGNLHCYRGNRSPSDWVAWKAKALALLPVLAPWQPWLLTETGTNDYTGPNQTGHTPTTPLDFAKQIVPDLIAWLQAGAEQVAFYEARDQGMDNNEGHFGLADHNYNPKPSANALKSQFLDPYGDLDELSGMTMATTLNEARSRILAAKAALDALTV